MSDRHWYEDHGELVALGEALDDAGCFDKTRDVVRYFEKPWKWSAERERWIAAGRPADYDFEEEDEAAEVSCA